MARSVRGGARFVIDPAAGHGEYRSTADGAIAGNRYALARLRAQLEPVREEA